MFIFRRKAVVAYTMYRDQERNGNEYEYMDMLHECVLLKEFSMTKQITEDKICHNTE